MRRSAEEILYGTEALDSLDAALLLPDTPEGRQEMERLLAHVRQGSGPLIRAALRVGNLHEGLWPELWGRLVLAALEDRGVPLPEPTREAALEMYGIWPEPGLLQTEAGYGSISNEKIIDLLLHDSQFSDTLSRWVMAALPFSMMRARERYLLLQAENNPLAQQMVASDITRSVASTLFIFFRSLPSNEYVRKDSVVHLLDDWGTLCGEKTTARDKVQTPWAAWADAPWRELVRCQKCQEKAGAEILERVERERTYRWESLLSEEACDEIMQIAGDLVAIWRKDFSLLDYQLRINRASREVLARELDRSTQDEHPLQKFVIGDDVSADMIRDLSLSDKMDILSALEDDKEPEAKARQVLLRALGR